MSIQRVQECKNLRFKGIHLPKTQFMQLICEFLTVFVEDVCILTLKKINGIAGIVLDG